MNHRVVCCPWSVALQNLRYLRFLLLALLNYPRLPAVALGEGWVIRGCLVIALRGSL
jgi:hypothetical protein